MTNTSITLRDALRIVPFALAARVPVLLLSSPGVGKSASLTALMQSAYWHDEEGKRQEGVPLWLVNLQHRDPSDLLGKQVVVETEDGPAMSWVPPVDALRLAPRKDGKLRPSVIFLDELPNAPRLIRGGMLKLLDHDRMFGSVRIAPEVGILAAGNRWSDRGLADKLDTTTMNRVLTLDVVPEYDSWLNWATEKPDTSDPWEYPITPTPSTPVHPLLLAWMAYRMRGDTGTSSDPEDVLKSFDAKLDEGKPFASGRSVDMLSRILKSGLPDMYWGAVAQGTVGERHGLSFLAFKSVLADLPDPAAMLADPEKCVIPSKIQHLFALAGVIPHHVTAATAPGFWKLIARFGKLAKETEGLMAISAYTMNSGVAMTCPEFAKWWQKPENQLIIRRNL